MITITDEPHAITPAGQKLMVVATSDNSTEPGFKFKVTIALAFPSTSVAIMYISPNPDGSLILDLNPLLVMRNAEILDSLSIHSFSTDIYALEPVLIGGGVTTASYELMEAWIVDEVLTDDPDEAGGVSGSTILWSASFQAKDGYKPSVADNFALIAAGDRMLSDRFPDTHRWQLAATFNVESTVTPYVYIPVREADYGVISIVRDISGDLADHVGVTIVDTNGSPHSFDIDLTAISDSIVAHLPVYPANLNASEESGWEKPEDYSGWRYISVVAVSAGSEAVSAVYILYNADRYGNSPCLHNNVRLGWVNSRGGWDYFNFYQKNELTDQIERKQYRKVLGTYGETYTMTGMERGLTNRATLVEQTLLFTSDWISENEFVFLRSLMVSKQVDWIQDNGTHIPVVIEDTSFIEKRERNGKLQQVVMRLKMANDYWT